MEAVLQKSKSKKQHKKSKHSSTTEISLVKDETRNCDNFVKSDERKFQEDNLELSNSLSSCTEKETSCDNFIKDEKVKLQKIDTEELVKSSETIIHSSAPSLEELSRNLSVINSENFIKNEETEKDLILSEENKIDSAERFGDTAFKSVTEISDSQVKKCSTEITFNQESVCSSEKTFIEKASLNVKQDLTKNYPLHLYPDLKLLHHCEKVHSILSSQTLVRTYAEKFERQTAVEANKSFKDFVKTLEDLDKHPLMDMIDQYQRAKKSSANFRSRLKYLKSDLKRKKDSLWKTVKKEAIAKGKCEDGYAVNVKHIYTIKELDQDRFNEVKSVLKEIEDLLLSDAFHSYLEEVVRLRIDHYVHELIENEDDEPKNFGRRFSDELSGRDSTELKKTISILFCSQRQNVQDSQYLGTCQKWLKTLASKMMKNGSFNDTLFVMNHVIRCPSGIANWASELIQIPVSISITESSEIFDSDSAQQILLALYLVLNPVPLKEFFLKNIKDSPVTDPADKFAVLDSDGEEEELIEMSKKFSDADVLSLLNQIPVRSLYKLFLLEDKEKTNSKRLEIKKLSDGDLLKLFAYSTAIIDVLFKGLETHYSDDVELFFESISNLIRHILLYISKYWTHHISMNNHFKSEIQAVYDKLFFHIVYKIYNFEKIHVWKILPALPYAHISEKMLWNILWIFFSPKKTEDQIYSEKDVEIKIKDDCVHPALINHIKDLSVHDIYHLLNAIEKIIKSCSFADKDFIKFSFYIIFKVTVLEPSLCKILSNEGLIILKDLAENYPILVSELLRKIDENYDNIPDSQQCINLFMKMNILNWIPEDSDVRIISSWLMLNLYDGRKQLACLLLKNMNWDYKEGQLFLPYDLHKRVAVIVAEAYVKFDADIRNEGLVSKGVKQMLQFTSMGSQREEEKFVHWTWNILFSLKLHPLDRKHSPWVEIYDGYVEESNETDLSSDFFQPLLSAYEKKHPCACYLMLVMSNEGRSLKGLLNGGLDCFSSLVDSEQYMAAINSLYYILPFFVKSSDELLEKTGFIKALSNLITADLTVISNITRKPVIGAVLHKVASVIKHQIYQAVKCTVECAAPLLKLWIKILMKMMSPLDNNSSTNLKNSAEQIHFLLDVCVKISFLHDYTRDSILDLFSSYCNPLSPPKVPPSSFWNRIFYSNSSEYPILNKNTIPDYPWLAWVVLYSEIKQKNVEDLWFKVSRELVKNIHDSSAACLKKVSQALKIDLEVLPIYRWALQAVATPVSHPVLPLIWQQFFLYFFQKFPVSNSEKFMSNGLKYFRIGQYEWLLKKIKKHLADSENFYRNLSRTFEVEAPEVLKNEESKPFYSSLAKLFLSFNLWIDNESLHESGVCLSALEPKYCPEWLELVLTGDKRIWFVLLSVPLLKDDIDQKIHSWSFSKRNSVIPVKSYPETEESLPKQLLRHLEKYETMLPVSKAETTTAVAVVRNELTFSSKEEIVHVIERNQALIFDKARYFCEQMKKLQQLNFNYINWIPQEYEIEDCEITESKVCHKGNGKDCSGAAYFRLKIQKCKKNVRISERIENNRADYVIVEDQLSKLPVKDLCISSLYIENCIRSLANKIKQANVKDAEYYRKMGIALFYHQMKRIDQVITSVAEYPPSRQFFSLIIESLGREFLDGDETELVELAKSILIHPESGVLALPLFDPNKSRPDNFVSLYSTLTSSVEKYSANTVLALFSKIDLNQWLKVKAPEFDVRKTIFNDICNALLHCGYQPSKELLPVFDILKRHFGIILKYMFPDLFLPSVDFLLKGVEGENLCVEVFYEAFNCFGCPLFNDKTSIDDVEYALKKFAENQQLPADQKMFVSVAQLNLQQVSFVCHLLYTHFTKKRCTVELYKRYAAFIKPLGIFLAIIGHSLVALHLEEISSINESLSVSELWQTFHLPFRPWLHPIADSSGLYFPWTDEELTEAHYVFKIFILSLKYFHEKVLSLGNEESVLSCLWLFYVEAYVTPGHRHYLVSVCHNELLNLPWHEFHPCTQDIEGMCRVLQSNLHESKEFLSKISLKIPWSSVMQDISLTKPPDYVGKVLATLGKLLIISQLDCAENDQDNLDLNIFKEMESLSWHYVSMNDIETLLDLAYSRLDPFLIVSNWNSGCEFHVLQFLKLICCMVPNPGAGEYSNSKRILYLKKFISTLSACCSSKETQMTKMCHKLSDIMSTLLDEIKVIICHVAIPNEQVNYALPLMKETLILLNGLPEGELSVAVLKSIISWLSLNKTSPLLLPCIKVSSQSLNSLSHKARLIECCISTRFRDETLDARETQIVWLLISSYFSLNSKIFEEFVKKCVEENAHLTLYCCILHKLPQSESVESKKLLLEQIYSWIKESELSCDAEAKFILLWDKLLELSIKLVYEQEYQVVRYVLTSFCWTLENLAQDKSNAGFFAIIGFGQSSALSVNFRFLCRVMMAYLQCQVPANEPIRIEPTDMESSDSCSPASSTSMSSAAKALENLKALQQKKLYSALHSQIDYAAKCVSDSKYTFLQSREVLKYFAAVLYPKDSFLSALDT